MSWNNQANFSSATDCINPAVGTVAITCRGPPPPPPHSWIHWVSKGCLYTCSCQDLPVHIGGLLLLLSNESTMTQMYDHFAHEVSMVDGLTVVPLFSRCGTSLTELVHLLSPGAEWEEDGLLHTLATSCMCCTAFGFSCCRLVSSEGSNCRSDGVCVPVLGWGVVLSEVEVCCVVSWELDVRERRDSGVMSPYAITRALSCW